MVVIIPLIVLISYLTIIGSAYSSLNYLTSLYSSRVTFSLPATRSIKGVVLAGDLGIPISSTPSCKYFLIPSSSSSSLPASTASTASTASASEPDTLTNLDITYSSISSLRNEYEAKEIELERERRAEEAERKAAEEAQRLRDSEEGTIKDVPDVASNFKAYMDYRCITATGSPQYRLQHDGNAETNSEGFRLYKGEYMVAMGSYYSTEIGTRFRITLDSGKQFYAVLGDQKSDAHTDALHQHRNGNVVEFIVDQSAIPAICSEMGDMSYAPEANLVGKVKSIEVLGSVFDTD